MTDTPSKHPEREKSSAHLVVTAILIVVCLGLLARPVSNTVYFLTGALFIVSAVWFAQQGRAHFGLTLGALLSGLALISVGVAHNVTEVPVRRNPVQDQPAVYYASWVQVQRQRCARRLHPGQAITLDFVPGPANRLRVATTNVPPARVQELTELLRLDFTTTYPGRPFAIELGEGAPSPAAAPR